MIYLYGQATRVIQAMKWNELRRIAEEIKNGTFNKLKKQIGF